MKQQTLVQSKQAQGKSPMRFSQEIGLFDQTSPDKMDIDIVDDFDYSGDEDPKLKSSKKLLGLNQLRKEGGLIRQSSIAQDILETEGSQDSFQQLNKSTEKASQQKVMKHDDLKNDFINSYGVQLDLPSYVIHQAKNVPHMDNMIISTANHTVPKRSRQDQLNKASGKDSTSDQSIVHTRLIAGTQKVETWKRMLGDKNTGTNILLKL